MLNKKTKLHIMSVQPVLEDIHICQSCNTHIPISRCHMCNILICACCIVEGGNCVNCFHDDNTIEALENYIFNKSKKKTRWFKVDIDSGMIVPVTRKKWWFCLY